MKKLLVLIAIIGFSKNYAQGPEEVKTTEEFARNAAEALIILNSNNAQQMGAFSYKNPAREVAGTTHLFDKWENHGVIVSSDGKRYAIKNINLDLRRQAFQSKYEGNKLFTFNFNNVDRFIVNNKVYKNYYYDDDVNVYEVLSDTQDFQLLKSYKLKFVEGSANPMLNRNVDRYIKKEYYFIKQGDVIKPFKLKKKKLLKLVGEDKASKMLDFADKNNLSFKKETDIKTLLESVK